MTNNSREAVRALVADDVQWIVNDNADLGVLIHGRAFFLYKGHSLVYEDGKHDDGTPMHYRTVGKREFGECAHPINYKDPSMVGTVSLGDIDRWQPLPALTAEPPVEGGDDAAAEAYRRAWMTGHAQGIAVATAALTKAGVGHYVDANGNIALTAAVPAPVAGDYVAMQPVAEIAMSDDGYKIGLLGPLRAHRLPLGTKLYASPHAALAQDRASQAAVPAQPSGEHCPKCRFTMSGVGRCVNCEEPTPAAQPSGAINADDAAQLLAAVNNVYALRTGTPHGDALRVVLDKMVRLATSTPAAVGGDAVPQQAKDDAAVLYRAANALTNQGSSRIAREVRAVAARLNPDAMGDAAIAAEQGDASCP